MLTCLRQDVCRYLRIHHDSGKGQCANHRTDRDRGFGSVTTCDFAAQRRKGTAVAGGVPMQVGVIALGKVLRNVTDIGSSEGRSAHEILSFDLWASGAEP